MPEIINHNYYNYKTFSDIPTEEELTEYYANKYFQTNTNYAYQMTLAEIEWKRAEATFLLDAIENVLPESMTNVVEVGSGEGFFLASALERGLCVCGIDFNTAQLHKDNVYCKEVFIESADPVDTACVMNPKPSCVVLRHVVEHVPDAVALVRQLSNTLSPGSALVIEMPHDFKPLQSYLTSEGLVEQEYWLCYPDHLSYFTPNQLSELLVDNRFSVRELYADFPIELLLLSKHLSYQRHSEMGKPAHLLRCAVARYLNQNTPFDDLLALYRSYAACQIGRNFTLIAERI